MASQVRTIVCTNSPYHRIYWVGYLTFCLAVMAAIATLFCSSAQGQQAKYDEMEIDERYRMESDAPQLIKDRRPRFEDLSEEEKRQINSGNRTARGNISTDSKNVEAIIAGSGSLEDPLIGDFFNGYVFAQMTRNDIEVTSKAGELREDFVKDFLPKDLPQARRKQFIDTVVLPSLNNIINNKDLKDPSQDMNYHPRVRMNAVVLIGLLDDQAGNRLANQVPIPSATAWAELNRIFQDANLPVGCRVSAMAGIRRHFEVDRVIRNQIPDPDKQKWMGDSQTILAGNAPGQDQWPTPVNYWLKRYAAQVMGLIGNPSSLDALLGVLRDEQQDWLRMDALQSIGQLDLRSVPKDKIKEASVAIAEFLAARFKQESETIDANVKKLVYDNMLFQDIDLEKDGTTYGPGQAMDMKPGASTGGPGGGPGGGRPSTGGFGTGGGMSGLSGGPGGGFGPPGFGPGGMLEEEKEPLLELPNYQLNQSRTRLTAFGFTAKTIFSAEDKGLKSLADDETKTFIDGVVRDIDRMLEDVNEGIVNLEEDRRNRSQTDDDEEQKSFTQKLSELCMQAANDLGSKVRAQKGEGEANPLAPGPAGTSNTSTDSSN